MERQMKKFFIIDGNAYIHRAYHALPYLATSGNQQVNAVFGFIKLLLKIKDNFSPDFITVCFDFPSKNFRHNIYKEYKAHRKPLDDALISQMPIARDAVEALNISKLEIKGYEADDLIASVTKKNKDEHIETVVVTGDKDILQLVKDGFVSVWNETKDVMYDEQKVFEKYGVKSDQLTDMFSLMGDVSDNVPGVKGIGEKSALKLMQEYKTLEKILENVKNIKGNVGQLLQDGKESALMSKELIKLNADAPINYKIDNFVSKEIDASRAIQFFRKYEFKSLIAKYGGSSFDEIQNKTEIKLPDNEVEIIDTMEKLKVLVIDIENKSEISIKTIISSMDSLKPQVTGIAVYNGNKAFYIPSGHDDFTAAQIGIDEIKKEFSSIISSAKIKKISCDLKCERNIYNAIGIEFNNLYFDISIAAYCVNPSKSNDIEELALNYFNYAMSDDSFLGKGAKKISFAEADIISVSKYAADIAYISYFVYKKLKQEIESKNLTSLFYNIEMPLASVLSKMEIDGIKVDLNFLKKLNAEISVDIKEIENSIYKLSDEEFNINSPKQLANILFEKMNLPVIKKTKTGYSTAEEVLTQLSEYQIAKDILKYREFQKLKSTYIDAIIAYCVYYGDRIHTVYNQTVTATGRLSSSDPNLQNIPTKTKHGNEIRKAFTAEKNCVFIAADYSQIDLRALAHISKDEKLIQAFKNGEDIHLATAREVFNIPADQEVPKELRSAAKSINFGIVYGMSGFGLSQQLNISVGKANEYIDGYFARYNGVKIWMKEIVKKAKLDGYVTTITGRIRYISELKAANRQIQQTGERIALNTPIQGTSADIIKIAMLEIDKEITNKSYKTKMLLQTHDDLLFEVPQDEKEIAVKMIKDKMENCIKLEVPLLVDMKIGENWGQMQKWQ
jgi:DNA polymerase-1